MSYPPWMLMLHTCGDVIPSLDVDMHIPPKDWLVSRNREFIAVISLHWTHRKGVNLTWGEDSINYLINFRMQNFVQSRIIIEGILTPANCAITVILPCFTETPHGIWIHQCTEIKIYCSSETCLLINPLIVEHLPYLVVDWSQWNSHCHDDQFHGNGPEPETRSMRRNRRILFMVFIFAAWNVDETKMFEKVSFEFLSCCKNNDRADFFYKCV